MLIDNGFNPEWITLQKEIREEADQLRKDLLMERKYFGPYPLSVDENITWSEKVYRYKTIVENINKKITKFNLVVPVLNKQMMHMNLENEAQKAVVNGKSSDDILHFSGSFKRNTFENKVQNSGSVSDNLMGLLDAIFKK